MPPSTSPFGFTTVKKREVPRAAKSTRTLDNLHLSVPAPYRARRRCRQYIGSGHVERANARIVARRQKRHGMHWSAQSCDAFAALRTLHLNNGWDKHWFKREALPLVVAA
jgi:hypothetical protein